MMSPRLETVKLTIQHMGNGGERMPIVCVHMSEGPPDPVEGKTVRDRWILVNVVIVIVVDELVPKGLAKNDPDKACKENRDSAGDEVLTISSRKMAFSWAASRSFFSPYRT